MYWYEIWRFLKKSSNVQIAANYKKNLKIYNHISILRKWYYIHLQKIF